MKNILKIFSVLIFSMLILSSCEKIKSVADVKFDTSLSANLDVVVPPASVRSIDGTFNESETIDPTSDPDIAEYLNNIQSYSIQSISAKIVAISKDVTLTNTTLSCFNGTQNASWTYANLPITLNTEVELDNTNGQWNTVNSILMTNQVFTVSASGTTSEDDVTFTIEVTINAEVTANPL